MTKLPDLADQAKEGTLQPHTTIGAEPLTPSGEPFRELRPLGSFLGSALERAERRRTRKERPIPLPWESVAAQLGGGLWPGMHVLVSGTGVGKTTLALQAALHAAEHGTPVAYVGLELDDLQVALRLVGERAGVPWSKLYLGQGSDQEHAAAIHAMADLEKLPLYLETGKPGGWPASDLSKLVASMRAKHPEQVPDENGQLRDVPGSVPMLVVLDFLQIIGGEEGERRDLRERIGAAAYEARDVARRFNCAVLLISSAARDKYGVLAGDITGAGLGSERRENGTRRRFIASPDTLIGLGKESGEIEYAADSVNVAVRMPAKGPDDSRLVVLATPKLRAGSPSWTVLRFSGTGFAEAGDEEADRLAGGLAGGLADAARKAAQNNRGNHRRNTASRPTGTRTDDDGHEYDDDF